jgi:hypothetical protein
MAALRQDRLSEILTQINIPYSYFAMLLNLQPGRHRYTYEMMASAMNFSGLAVMQFKHHFRIRRPADHSALVQPVIQTPAHGAFPAGHACQCNFLSALLTKLVGTSLGPGSDVSDQMQQLADRIGENRVVAGVHYKKDITDGAKLGKALAKYFIKQAEYTGPNPKTALQWLWKNAAKEWD